MKKSPPDGLSLESNQPLAKPLQSPVQSQSTLLKILTDMLTSYTISIPREGGNAKFCRRLNAPCMQPFHLAFEDSLGGESNEEETQVYYRSTTGLPLYYRYTTAHWSILAANVELSIDLGLMGSANTHS